MADEYIITSGALFAQEISKLDGRADAVVSSHNLEHCDNRQDVVRNMARALRPGGGLYLSFLSAATTDFPGRGGCLNYYDDGTHQGTPPDFGEVIAILYEEGVWIRYATTQYQPPLGWLIGLQAEQYSQQVHQVQNGTWWLWGFETVIWGEKRG